MSINDLLDSEIFLPAMAVIFVFSIICAIFTGIKQGKNANGNIYGDYECGFVEEEKNVKIVARRTAPHPLNQAVMINMVVFELKNGNRIEFAIKDSSTYGTMVEGDCGTLRYQGKKFVDFKRGV